MSAAINRFVSSVKATAVAACQKIGENPKNAMTTVAALSALSWYTGKGITSSMMATATILGIVSTSSGTGIWNKVCTAAGIAGLFSWAVPGTIIRKEALWVMPVINPVIGDATTSRLSTAIILGLLVASTERNRGVSLLMAAGAMGLGAYAWVKSNALGENSLSFEELLLGNERNVEVDKMRSAGLLRSQKIRDAVRRCPPDKLAELNKACCTLNREGLLFSKVLPRILDTISAHPQHAKSLCAGLVNTKNTSFLLEGDVDRWRIVPKLCEHPEFAEEIEKAWFPLARTKIADRFLRVITPLPPERAISFSNAWQVFRLKDPLPNKAQANEMIEKLPNHPHLVSIGRVLGRLITGDQWTAIKSEDFEMLLKHAASIDSVFPPLGSFSEEIKRPLSREEFDAKIAELEGAQ